MEALYHEHYILATQTHQMSKFYHTGNYFEVNNVSTQKTSAQWYTPVIQAIRRQRQASVCGWFWGQSDLT